MAMNRRDFLRGSAVVGSTAALSGGVLLRPLLGGSPVSGVNLVVVELIGGNDGFNTFVPYAVNGGLYYSHYRETLSIEESKLLKVPGQPVAFHPAFGQLKNHFDAGRLAVLQGVSVPDPTFSHTQARRVWRSGDPTGQAGDGWLGRYLARYPAPAFPTAAEVFQSVTQLTSGAPGVVPALQKIEEYKFPFDPLHPEEAGLRRAMFDRIAKGNGSLGGSLGAAGQSSTSMLDLIDAFATIPAAPTGYPNEPFAQALRTGAQLLGSGLGVRLLHVGLAGFDTHTDQKKNGYHASLLSRVSHGLAAFQADLVHRGIDQQTLVIVGSEFGRTIYENASGGCDHGTVSPVMALGAMVAGGIINEHPSLKVGDLTEHSEPPMAVDFRDVVGTVLTRWFGESQSAATEILLGHPPVDLGFLA